MKILQQKWWESTRNWDKKRIMEWQPGGKQTWQTQICMDAGSEKEPSSRNPWLTGGNAG